MFLSYEQLLLERHTYTTQEQVNQFQLLFFQFEVHQIFYHGAPELFLSQNMHASTDTNFPSGKTKIFHALILDEIIELSCKLIFTH